MDCLKPQLTHIPLDNMAAISQTIFSDAFLFMKFFFSILIKISLKFVCMEPVDNKPALVPIMALRRISDKSLREPMLTQFTDAYMRR